MKRLLLILFLFTGTFAKSQTVEAPSPIKWYTIEEAEALAKKQPRPLFIDVYTDWCGWCKHMMKTTFSNKDIANYIQNNFYPVRYDAETKDTIVYKGKKYVNSDFLKTEQARIAAKKAGKKFQAGRSKFTHDLAKEILQGRLSYPTIVYTDKAGNPNPVPGYMDVNKIQPLLVYFAEELHKAVSFDEFNSLYYYAFPKSYQKEINELQANQKLDTTGVVKWYSWKEAQELNKKQPKKILLDLYADFRVSCRVMGRTTYNNPDVAKVINEHFYPVRFNSMSKEEIDFMGKKLINEGKQHPFHQLAVNFAVSGQEIIFPTLVFFDKSMKTITKNQQYVAPSVGAPFFEFIGTDAYKSQKWPEYQKAYMKKKGK